MTDDFDIENEFCMQKSVDTDNVGAKEVDS